jgi:AcrR family transcriptional regulator
MIILIKMPKKNKYHHLDLRTKLLETTTEMIVNNGVETVTMRSLSQKIGVSRTAPYRHFSDKTALLCAIAEEGFYKIKDALDKIASNKKQDPLISLKKMALAYVDFAINNPAYYRLMFGKEVVSNKTPLSLQIATKESFQKLTQTLEQCQKEKSIKKMDITNLANSAWATLHGLSMLLIDGQISPNSTNHELKNDSYLNKEAIQKLINLSITNLIAGMKKSTHII